MSMKSSESGGSQGSNGLPHEILSVIPTDPYSQLDMARKITSMVITSRIIELETELGRLGCQKLYDKDKDKDKDPVLADLEDKLSRLQQAYQETNLGFKIALEHNAISSPPKSSSCSKYADQFIEIEKIAKGGFGIVCKCQNKLDDMIYAVKKVPFSLGEEETILREVKLLCKAQHTNVVRYYQVWIEDGVPTLSCSSDTASDSSSSYAHSSTLYLLMEYCSSTLKNELENPEGFEKSKIWPFFRGIVEGLVHVHGQDIIHRDISRDNIFIDGSGVPKLGDFGLAINNGDVAAGYEVEGNQIYRAPELNDGSLSLTTKVDIYSLGLILVELLYPMGTGMERGTVLNNINNGILPIDWGYDDDVTRFVLRLLKTNPSQRPSASQILTTVADW